MKNTKTAKIIPNKNYKEVFDKFTEKKGKLYPIYADCVYQPLNTTSSGNYISDTAQVGLNLINLLESGGRYNNKIVGYFACVKSQKPNEVDISMSFCDPIDFSVFSKRYGKLLAMNKALKGDCLYCHVEKKQRTIGSDNMFNDPIYYFCKDNTVNDQFNMFYAKSMERLNKTSVKE